MIDIYSLHSVRSLKRVLMAVSLPSISSALFVMADLTAVATVVHSQLPTMYGLRLQCSLRSLGGSDVNEVCVRKAPWLTGPSVDSNADIQYIANFAEEICKSESANRSQSSSE